MHARDLVDLAGVLAAHGPVLIRGLQPISDSGLEQYWTASKCRLDRWAWSLKSFANDALDPKSAQVQWPFVRGVIEEILTGEVLTRVWTAVLSAHDRQHKTDQAEPIARSVLIGHLEARHRVLMLLVRGPGIGAEAAVQMNHLRRSSERWCDLLVGYLAGLADVSELAVEPKRAREFAEDLQYQKQFPGGKQAWPLVQAGLRAAFRQRLCPVSPNADLNARIASSILASFPPELFDSTGQFRSLWLLHLTNVTADAQGMIDQLLVSDQTESEKPVNWSSSRISGRTRRFEA